MDGETIINQLLIPLIQNYAHSLVTSKIITVLKLNVVLLKLGFSKTTVAIILLLM